MPWGLQLTRCESLQLAATRLAIYYEKADNLPEDVQLPRCEGLYAAAGAGNLLRGLQLTVELITFDFTLIVSVSLL